MHALTPSVEEEAVAREAAQEAALERLYRARVEESAAHKRQREAVHDYCSAGGDVELESDDGRVP